MSTTRHDVARAMDARARDDDATGARVRYRRDARALFGCAGAL
jgi:hypothetical protein